MLRSGERTGARAEQLGPGRAIASSAAGGLASRARRVGQPATALAALCAFGGPATHARCLGHVYRLAPTS